MNKSELAGYLVNLHNLLEAQEKTGVKAKSVWIIAEYNKTWQEFQDAVTKEDKDEDSSSRRRA